jgi:hypothetical protein
MLTDPEILALRNLYLLQGADSECLAFARAVILEAERAKETPALLRPTGYQNAATHASAEPFRQRQHSRRAVE